MADEPRADARPEVWVVATWGLAAAELALAVYLGLKLEGVGPVRAYMLGLPGLALLGLLMIFVGAIWSVLRRPFVRPHRLVAFCVLGFVVSTASYPLPFPANRADAPSRVEIHLPVVGEWTVAWGGQGEINALMQTRPDRRFGCILVRARDGLTRAKADDPRSAFAFGEPVVAPCEGSVVRVVDGVADDGGSGTDDLGNHVVLAIAPGEFLFLAGLQSGSIAVKEGEHVARGAPLARVGFSAISMLTPEPHLSIHVQDTPDALLGQGVPFLFHDYWSGDAHVERDVPQGAGLFVGRPITGPRIRSAP